TAHIGYSSEVSVARGRGGGQGRRVCIRRTSPRPGGVPLVGGAVSLRSRKSQGSRYGEGALRKAVRHPPRTGFCKRLRWRRAAERTEHPASPRLRIQGYRGL